MNTNLKAVVTQELKRIWDEIILEIFGDKITEYKKVRFDLIRDLIIMDTVGNDVNDKERRFIVDNIAIYKSLFIATLKEDDLEQLKLVLEIAKLSNEI